MSVNVNFGGVDEAQDFPLIPEGTYVGRCVEVDDGNTTSKGDAMWKTTWRVVGGPHDGAKVWDNLVFGGAALGRLKMLCRRVCGLDVTGNLSLAPNQVGGRFSTLKIVHEVGNDGKTRAKIAFAGFDVPPAKIPDSRFASEPVVYKTGGAAAPAAGAKEDDDMPF